MVATRRGVRVYSSTTTNSDESSAVHATPSTGRRTRGSATQVETTQPAQGEETSSQPAQGEETSSQPAQGEETSSQPAQGEETSSQPAEGEETSSQPAEGEGGPPLSPQSQTSRIRCTRASRLHSPEQPCTPVGSAHEADVSDLESCCSLVFDNEPPVTRSRARRRQPHSVSQDEVSEVESCSSAVSNSNRDQSTRRSTRSTRKKKVSSPHAEVGSDGKADAGVEVESCSSVVSDSQRVTRSLRKIAHARSSARRQAEHPELSDADSCPSSVSGAEACMSTTSRATRSRRRVQPIPMHLDEASEGSGPGPLGRRTRSARGKAAATVVVSEPQSCDSEGFESGPSMSPQRTARRRGKARCTDPKALDSDSELTDMQSPLGSPISTRSGRTTRCSVKAISIVLERTSTPGAQTGEQANSQARTVTVSQPAEEGGVLNDSRLESTEIADPDGTLLEEDKTLTLDKEKDDTTNTDLTSNCILPEDAEVIEIGRRGSVTTSMTADVEMGETTGAPRESTDTTAMEKAVTITPLEDEEMDPPADSQVSPSHPVTLSDSPCHTEEAEVVSEPAVTTTDQQRELSTENKDGNASEMAMMQETVPSSEPLELPSSQSVTVTVYERALTSEVPEETEENDKAMEIDDVDTHPSQTERLEDKPLDGATIVETLPGGDEEMEVSTPYRDAQQVVDSSEVPGSPAEPDQVQGESIQVTSSQEQKVSVEPGPEQQPKDAVIVQIRETVSLLESSEDEDEYVEEEEEVVEGSGEEDDLGRMEEERAGPSKRSAAAAASVDGLFMIDTRPGQEADEQYYDGLSKKGTEAEEAEQEEHDEEEFVDEEGDDEDDEDAQTLFSSRNPQLKELSSRIDPGLRMKELGGLYINFDGSKSKPVSSSLKKLKEQKIQDEVMKRSVIGPDFEKKDAVPPYSESKQALKCKRKVEREKTTGDSWFNMKAPELTEELRGDLKLLKMRGSLDSKRFYKKNDRDGFPKYFQIGTVVDNPADFYHSRIPKKERKRTMVEELLADAELRHNNKKKYQQIMTEKATQGAGKRNKKRNKFHKKKSQDLA